VTAKTSNPDELQLRHDSLGLPELVFHAVTHIAPATSVVLMLPSIAHHAGPAMPISFALSTIVCLSIGATVYEFSRYVPSSGSYYSFATRGLGNRSGFMATWSYLIYEIVGAAACIGFIAYLLSDMLRAAFHFNVPWWLLGLAMNLLIWTLTHRGVQLSARVTALLGGAELLIMLSLGITFLLHPGPGSSYFAPLRPSSSPTHFEGILAGMVFSILALSGFEAPAPLAQEARLPNKSIGQAIMLSLVVVGVFYIFMAYASAIGWGTGDMEGFASNANPYYALGHSLWGARWWFVVLAIVNSAIGTGIACTNVASRVMYTMGQAGTLPRSFGRIHPVYRTPAFAIAVSQIVAIAAILMVGMILRPEYIFSFLGTVATLAIIVLYVMANLALTPYMRREQKSHFAVWQHVLLPWLGTLVLFPVLFVTVYPAPAWPYNLTPYLFVILLLAGLAYMQWREWRTPGTLHRAAMMIIRRRRTGSGELETTSINTWPKLRGAGGGVTMQGTTILAGDVGGTKIHLALYHFVDGKLEHIRDQQYPARRFSGLEEIANQFLDSDRPKLGCFGVAGPVREGRIRITNLPWTIDSRELAIALNTEHVFLINDSEANGYGIGELSADQVYTLNEGNGAPTGNRALIAAGTGLGEVYLVWNGHSHIPYPSEGGHADFAPCNDDEMDLYRYLRQKYNGRISYDRVVAGQGLTNIYEFLRDVRRMETPTWLVERISHEDLNAVISELALLGKSAICEKALDMFVSVYGAEAGNLALKILSSGGLYVGGGIAPRILEKLKDGTFMKAFTDKGRLSPLLIDMPVRIVLDSRAALVGAASYAKARAVELNNISPAAALV
jgi:glucokinase